MKDDPIVAEVRRVREQLAERQGFEVSAIFEDLRKQQAKLGSSLTLRKRKHRTEQASTSDRDTTTLHPGR